MNEEKEQTIIMECPCSYLLMDENGAKIFEGEGTVRLSEESFSIFPKFAEVLFCFKGYY